MVAVSVLEEPGVALAPGNNRKKDRKPPVPNSMSTTISPRSLGEACDSNSSQHQTRLIVAL